MSSDRNEEFFEHVLEQVIQAKIETWEAAAKLCEDYVAAVPETNAETKIIRDLAALMRRQKKSL